MRWVEVAIDAAADSADAVSNILMEEGCGGSAALNRMAPGIVRVLGYLPADDRVEACLNGIRGRISHLPSHGLSLASHEIGVKWVEDEAWATAWKRFFRPVRVGRIVVKPSWEDYAAESNDVIVELDPGMAFGTGYHPTTQLCLLALQERMRGGETVLDVGTGSGILAIAAVRLGAERVVGLEIDSLAIEVARANVERLGLQDRIEITKADSPLAFGETADIIIANIIAKTVIEMAPDLKEKLAPRGTLVTSGIVTERMDEVGVALDAAGLHTAQVMRDGEWAALISQHEG